MGTCTPARASAGCLNAVVVGFMQGLEEQDPRGLLPDLLHLGDDGNEAAAVGNPLLVEAGLGLGEATCDGLAGVVASPLPVGAMRPRWVGVAAAAGGPAGGVAEDNAALADEAEFGDLAGEVAVAALEFVEPGR